MSALRKLPSASQPDTSIAEIIDDVKKPLSLCKVEEKLDQLRQRHTALSQQIALVLDQADVNGRLHPDLKSVERDARAEKASVEREINKARVEVMAGRRAHDGEIRKAIAP